MYEFRTRWKSDWSAAGSTDLLIFWGLTGRSGSSQETDRPPNQNHLPRAKQQPKEPQTRHPHVSACTPSLVYPAMQTHELVLIMRNPEGVLTQTIIVPISTALTQQGHTEIRHPQTHLPFPPLQPPIGSHTRPDQSASARRGHRPEGACSRAARRLHLGRPRD